MYEACSKEEEKGKNNWIFIKYKDCKRNSIREDEA